MTHQADAAAARSLPVSAFIRRRQVCDIFEIEQIFFHRVDRLRRQAVRGAGAKFVACAFFLQDRTTDRPARA